jgi:hypothetical protein
VVYRADVADRLRSACAHAAPDAVRDGDHLNANYGWLGGSILKMASIPYLCA